MSSSDWKSSCVIFGRPPPRRGKMRVDPLMGRAGDRGRDDGEDERAVEEPERATEKDAGSPDDLEDGGVDEGEQPAVQAVNQDAGEPRPIAVGGDHGAEEVRDVHAGEAEALAA